MATLFQAYNGGRKGERRRRGEGEERRGRGSKRREIEVKEIRNHSLLKQKNQLTIAIPMRAIDTNIIVYFDEARTILAHVNTKWHRYRC